MENSPEPEPPASTKFDELLKTLPAEIYQNQRQLVEAMLENQIRWMEARKTPLRRFVEGIERDEERGEESESAE